jgi:hypothetical protein
VDLSLSVLKKKIFLFEQLLTIPIEDNALSAKRSIPSLDGLRANLRDVGHHRAIPPFYVYLGVIALLAANHIVSADRMDFINAATYIWNYRLNSSARILGYV